MTTLELETAATRALTTHTDSNFAPRFSPDRDSIAHSSDRTWEVEIRELVVVDLETRESETLGNGPHAEMDVASDGSARCSTPS